MSGGSLDYAYQKVSMIIENLTRRTKRPLHKAFAKHLKLVETALHDIEWVLSCDYKNGDEDDAIRAVIKPQYELQCAIEEAMGAKKALEDILKRANEIT